MKKPKLSTFKQREEAIDRQAANPTFAYKSSLDLDSVSCQLATQIYEKIGSTFTPIPNGEIQRFPAPGKPPSNNACWVWFSEDGTFAKYGNHITGETFTWQAHVYEARDSEKTDEHREQLFAKRNSQRLQRIREQDKAAERALFTTINSKSAKIPNSYLTAKNVKPHNLRQDKLSLIVVLRNLNDDIVNVQRIYENGDKRFMKGARVKGAFATIEKRFTTGRTFICEGWATAATIHELTGDPVIAAMSAGNLRDVCIAIASERPEGEEIVIAADNDHRTLGNPGLTMAKEATEVINCKLTYPLLPCPKNDCTCTDFNDYHNCNVKGGTDHE
jgi:putative DNA primase/helicase